MSRITTHILDTSRGLPAQEVAVALYKQQDGDWKEIAGGLTGQEGRLELWSPASGSSGARPPSSSVAPPARPAAPFSGIYKIKFATKEYFERLSVITFYPYVEITFEISDKDHYHIPLLLNPYGFTTYRGT